MRNGRLARFDKIGVELEGGWDDCPPQTPYAQQASDGSVQTRAYWNGEVRIGPVVLTGGVWETLLRDYWPNHVDSSCGLHVHLSLRRECYYQLLADVDCWAFLRHRLTEYALLAPRSRARLASRVRGENQYCRSSWQPYRQLNGTGERYTAINWCAYEAHHTIETRVLPMTQTAGAGIRMISEVINCWADLLDDAIRQSWRVRSVARSTPLAAEVLDTEDAEPAVTEVV